MRYNILTYHIGEGIRNLFKNKKSTIASLCIMMATMLMFGIFFIIGENINHIMETIEEDQGMKVFIIDEASSKEVQEKIRNIEIDGKKYVDPDIRSSDKTINALINIANGIKIITGVLLVLLIAISIFIISNTIKLTVHARRKEISIMKYVGATNSFIRWPFIVEGIIIGIISALLTILIIYGGYTVVVTKILNVFNSINVTVSLLTFADMYKIILVVYMVLGIGIGALGSSISMRKYLEV